MLETNLFLSFAQVLVAFLDTGGKCPRVDCQQGVMFLSGGGVTRFGVVSPADAEAVGKVTSTHTHQTHKHIHTLTHTHTEKYGSLKNAATTDRTDPNNKDYNHTVCTMM